MEGDWPELQEVDGGEFSLVFLPNSDQHHRRPVGYESMESTV